MTTIHVQEYREQAVISRAELGRLLELARRSEQVDVQIADDDEVTTRDIMRLAEAGGAFDWLFDEGEDIYSLQDGEAV